MLRHAMTSHAMLSYVMFSHDTRSNNSATCWEMASGGNFVYRFLHRWDLSGPPAGKWLLEATFRIDSYARGTSPDHLLGNGLQSSLFVQIHMATCKHY